MTREKKGTRDGVTRVVQHTLWWYIFFTNTGARFNRAQSLFRPRAMPS